MLGRVVGRISMLSHVLVQVELALELGATSGTGIRLVPHRLHLVLRPQVGRKAVGILGQVATQVTLDLIQAKQ